MNKKTHLNFKIIINNLCYINTNQRNLKSESVSADKVCCIKRWSLIHWQVYLEPNWVQFSSFSPKPSFPTAQKMLGWLTKLLLSDVLHHIVPPYLLQFIDNHRIKKTASYSSTHVLIPNFNFSINTIHFLWLPFFHRKYALQILQCY